MGNSFIMHNGKWGNSGPKVWQVPLLSIFRHSITFPLHYRRVGGPEASELAGMMSTGMRTFFQSGVQKNLKSLYQSFVPQKFASAHVCANKYNRKNKFLVRSIQTRLDCVVKPLCPKSAVKINIGTLVQSL